MKRLTVWLDDPDDVAADPAGETVTYDDPLDLRVEGSFLVVEYADDGFGCPRQIDYWPTWRVRRALVTRESKRASPEA